MFNILFSPKTNSINSKQNPSLREFAAETDLKLMDFVEVLKAIQPKHSISAVKYLQGILDNLQEFITHTKAVIP